MGWLVSKKIKTALPLIKLLMEFSDVVLTLRTYREIVYRITHKKYPRCTFNLAPSWLSLSISCHNLAKKKI